MATTEELMSQYGVAWFGFDEASGNVTDKLGGSYVGTVTGATRVEGWNGEGKAMNFSGSGQYVTFNNHVIPTTNFTIRLKVKLKDVNYTYYILTTQLSGGSDKGIRIQVNAGGYVGLYVGNGSYLLSQNIIKEASFNKWYDIIISYSSLDNKVETSINGVLVNKALLTGVFQGSGTNLLLGRINPSHTTQYAACVIDDLQVYNKALSLSDFTQKHIAIKTSDNKNLVLPNKTGRVKEIPSSDEIDLINQGYTWREIDDAVDSQVIDLTQTTTEYEKVSKTNTPLGNGKMFTIPLDEFKTISIEDNY